MFGIWKRKAPEVLNYKFQAIENFQTSVTEFYDELERAISAYDLPGLDISRIEFAEGGLLSANRMYLRMRRERLVFDVCTAPFGKGWFFSYRFWEIPCELMLWEIIVILLFLAAVLWGYMILFGTIWGAVLFVASILSILVFMRKFLDLGLDDIDAALLQIPILGAFYELLLRKNNTYFREDSRNAYMTFVETLIVAKTNELTKAKGIDLADYRDLTPPSLQSRWSMIAELLRMGR